MAIQRHEAVLHNGEGGALRWRRMSAIALASVLVWTIVLGFMLAPRWPGLTSFAGFGRNQGSAAPPGSSMDRANAPQPGAEPATVTFPTSHPRPPVEAATATARTRDPQSPAEPTTPVVRGRDDYPAFPDTSAGIPANLQSDARSASAAAQPIDPTDPAKTVLRTGESVIDFGKQAAVRPKAYSSIDAQTLAAARVRGEALAGKLVPATDSALAIVGVPENNTTALTAAPDQPTSPVAQSSNRSQESPSRLDLAQPSPSVRDMKRATPVSRTEVAPQPRNSSFDPPRVVRVAPAIGTDWRGPVPTPTRLVRVAPANQARDLEAPLSPGFARATPSQPPLETTELAGAQKRVAPAPAAPSRPQQDAAAAQLDDSWERRERWLRERLQPR